MPFGTSLPSPPTLFPIYILPSIPFRRRRRRSSTSTTPPSTSSSPSSSPGTTPPTPSYLSGSTSHLRCSHCLTDLCLTSQIISKGFTGRHGRAYLVSPSSPSSSSSSSPSSSPRAKNNNGGGSNNNNNKTLLQDRDIDNLPNTHTHKPVPRQLVTGAHTVCDISCALCGKVLGWKYLDAEEEAQKYKVGKYILETKRVCRGVDWENGGGGGAGVADGEGGVGWRAATPAEVMERVGDRGWGGGGGKEHKRKDSIRSYDPGNDMYEDEEEGGAAWDDEVEFDSQDEDECEDLFTGVWTPQLARKRRESKGFPN